MTVQRKLWLYTNGVVYGWFADAATARRGLVRPGSSAAVYRAAHIGIPAPDGYRKTGRELANDPVEHIPTMRDFVKAF